MQKIVTAPGAAGSRLRSIQIEPSGETYFCGEAETLLEGMTRMGRRGIPVGCVNGGCGVCKIGILTGRVRQVGAMSRAHVSIEEEARGVCLACRVAPLEELVIEVVGKMSKAFTLASVSSASS